MLAYKSGTFKTCAVISSKTRENKLPNKRWFLCPVCVSIPIVCVCSTLNIWVCFLSYVTCQALFLKVTFRVTIVSYRPYMLFSHGLDRCHFVVSTSRRRFQRPLPFPQTDGVFSNRCRFHKPMAFSATAVVSTKRWRFQQPLSFP